MARPRKNKPVDNPDKKETTNITNRPVPKEDDNGVEVVEWINDNGQIISTQGTFPVPEDDEFNGTAAANRLARQRAEKVEKKD